MKKILLLVALFSALPFTKTYAGDGTVNNPYTVAEARALAKSNDKIWVQGYIVGGRYDDFDQPWSNDYGVSIADNSGESNFDNCIQIKFEKSTGHRDLYGLKTNPGAYGKEIKAYGFRDDYGGASYPSIEGITSTDYIVEVSSGGSGDVVGSPTFDPAAGTYTTTQDITISSSTSGALIYYTVDGSTPDQSSTLYSTPVTVSETTTIKAIAYSDDNASNVSTADYTLELSSTDASIPYEQNFTLDAGNFATESVNGDQVWHWSSFDGGCMTMSGHDTDDFDNTDWLISPTFDFSNYTNLQLTFREAINYMTSYNDLQVMISTDYNGDATTPATWTELAVSGRSTGDNWDFVDVDQVDLSAYEGETTVTIGFKFTSTTAGASTWEISKVNITGTEAAIVEPSNHVSNFTATTGAVTTTSIELAWNENDGAAAPDGYLIKASTEVVTAPTDSVDITDDTDLTDGMGNVKVAHGTTGYTFDNCSPGTTYNFSIFPYAGAADSILYKIDDAPTAQATTESLLIEDPISFTAMPASTSEIDLNWQKNNLGQQVIVATEMYSEVAGMPADSSAYAVNDTLPGGGVVIYAGSAESFSHTSLEVSTYYYYKIWSVSDAGIYSTGISANAATLAPEPSNQVENFNVDSTGLNTIVVTWNNIAGGIEPDGYLLTINDIQVNIVTLVDGTEIPGDTDISDGTGSVIVSNETEAYTWEGLNSNTTYILSIYPYTNSGEFIDYKTDGVPNLTASTIAGVSTPEFSPVSGTYADSVEIAITCKTVGATIYYTLDGSTPDNSSIPYSAPFMVYDTTTITAIAYLEEENSLIGTATYNMTITPLDVAEPVFTPEAGTYNDSILVSISCTTEDAAIYYNLNGLASSLPYTEYTEPFYIYKSTSIAAYAKLNSISSEPIGINYIVETTPIEVNSLAELRAGETNGTLYHFNGEAVVTYAMDFRNQKYIQDETGAVMIDDDAGIITADFEIGDGITGLTGTLSDYNGLLEFIPTKNTNPSSTSKSIEAQEITISELKSNFEDYESELIRFAKVRFEASGTFVAGTNYVISNDNAETIVLRSHFYDADYIDTEIIEGSLSVTGIALWHSNEAKIVPRMTSDMEKLTSVNDKFNNIQIYSFNHRIQIIKPEGKAKVEVYSFDGRKIKYFDTQEAKISINMFQNGLYLVVLKSDNATIKVQKVAIQ